MNLANKLTITRICMVPLFILFVELNGFLMSVLALLVFSAASITDYFDGQIARKNNIITPLGTFLDPLADKLLISAAFICFVDIPYLDVPAWMVIAIISREFIITGLRSIAASQNVIIAADKAGKFKTTSQMVVIITVLLIIIVHEAFTKFYHVPLEMFLSYGSGTGHILALILQKAPYWMTLAATVLTVYSGINYIWKHKSLFNEN